MTYTVKEIFKSVQGEGHNAGRVAVFCRFTGCNLWSGHEKDRAQAICKFCDTDFAGGDKYADAVSLVDAIEQAWGPSRPRRFVVLTGGEPALQYDAGLRTELHKRSFFIAIETNGTICLRAGVDWLCVSPKANTEIVLHDADELKLVYPQIGLSPHLAAHGIDALHYSVQPMDGPDFAANTQAAYEFAVENPKWKLSIQMHKAVGVR